MKRISRRTLIISAMALSILTAGIIGGRHLYINSPGYGLPYYARFTPDVEDRWTALGGAWEIVEGAMRNDANDRGAKLLMGSPNWKDYIVEADVQLQGEGSVGVLARVSEAEVGENSFKGYFLGVRTIDNSLVLGAFEFAYHEVARVVLPDPVRPLRWYHVKLKVDGCQITAYASAQGMGEVQTAPLNDPDCFRSGVIALRSNGTGGIWRNVRVSQVDSLATDAGAVGASQASLPQVAAQRGGTQSAGDGAPSAPIQTIRYLSYLPPFGSPPASVRGSVILIRPAVYIQDSTGGVEVQFDNATTLKIGDEVEVTGEVDLDKFSPVIRRARFRLLREAVPVSPVVLTANQVAEAQYDSRFVQVEGYLRAISEGNDGAIALDLDAGAQSFRAILPPGRSRSLLQRLAQESRLRLRGVSVVDARFNKEANPFAILVRSPEDVEVLAGPPWWRPSTLILATLAGLTLIIILNYLYLLAIHWRLRAVADERERLANEIHDTLAQSFAGIGFQLQAIRNSLPHDAELLKSQVDLAISMARTSHGEARRSIANLRPISLGGASLLPALRECAVRMVNNGNLTVEAYGEDGGRTVPPRIKDTLYLIGQEAIANSIRHAAPDTIRIRLERTRGFIYLSIEDDGQGFIADSHCTGFGILGMRNRAESISAMLTVKSTPGSGTWVEVKAPVRSHILLGLWPRPRFSATRNL
jgi:signal transduction histidine kinase